MKVPNAHSFHIPVMGLAFTIDSPLKVARFGINSVVSIVEDELIESMREVICKRENKEYVKIQTHENDSRARRITSYLDLLNEIVNEQIEEMRLQSFEQGTDLYQYFDLLPDYSSLKSKFKKMLVAEGDNQSSLQQQLKRELHPGSIDVNIMTKIDKINYDVNGNELPTDFSDALSALRGFANSQLHSSVVFSAGLNPRLYAYCEKFDDFYPDSNGQIKKKIILKVSDYRSALIQGKYLAKKGLWVSEFRIESGINCGGHAFVSNGMLIGPILEEFKSKRAALQSELLKDCESALNIAKRHTFQQEPEMLITAQGGIGTAYENTFLENYYHIDSTGWGSPFLLVPEATSVDTQTLHELAKAKKQDYYLSHASPLGVPFHNFKPSTSETQRLKRISANRPGSPCYKKFLVLNKEFTDKPICTASREFQKLKIEQLKDKYEAEDPNLKIEIEQVIEKDCLCEGLGASALLAHKTKLSHKLSAVTICPGPNLAYFSGIFSLKQMVDHIYGRTDLLNSLHRPILFINELQLYVDYLIKDIKNNVNELTEKKVAHYQIFKKNLMEGISYYEELFSNMHLKDTSFQLSNIDLLGKIKNTVNRIILTERSLTV